jgi:peptide/nickel transport system ATP-binding protein
MRLIPMGADMTTPLLSVRDLRTVFPTRQGQVVAIDGISFDVHEGETLCIVGESGSGKSVTARSILQIVDKPGRIAGGQMLFRRPDGQVTDLAALHPRKREIRAIRGAEIAMIFQEPMSSLSPVHRVGSQIDEALRLHTGLDRAARRARVVELLRQVEIARPEQAADRYTFEFSGGMRQRVMIAMALACNPRLLIADEPTTALDVTTQAEILDLIARLGAERKMAVMFITHDMGVVAEIADRVIVMHQGRIRETGTVDEIFHAAGDDYTRMLLGSVRKLSRPAEVRAPRAEAPILRVEGLTKSFKGVRALDGVSFDLAPGEILGIVGESGSGKTTMGRALLGIHQADAGRIFYRRPDGSETEVAHARGQELHAIRREIRMIFQDPQSSLNSRKTVAQIIGEPIWLAGLARGKDLDDRVAHLMERVGLRPEWRERYPHAFSGGQRQRIGIARAIALDPRIIVADEPTSALDVSIRAQMLDLMKQLQAELGLSYVLISHDISVIRYMCDRVGVMYRGRLVELGDTRSVTENPAHGYTRALLSAIPNPDPRDRRLSQRFRFDEAIA